MRKWGLFFNFLIYCLRTTVFDNVKLPLTYTKISKEEKNKRTKEAIEAVGLVSSDKSLF